MCFVILLCVPVWGLFERDTDGTSLRLGISPVGDKPKCKQHPRMGFHEAENGWLTPSDIPLHVSPPTIALKGVCLEAGTFYQNLWWRSPSWRKQDPFLWAMGINSFFGATPLDDLPTNFLVT